MKSEINGSVTQKMALKIEIWTARAMRHSNASDEHDAEADEHF
jgi:hypothetical protein